MSMNYDTASVLEVEDGIAQESLYSEVSKLRLKDAVVYYQGLLAQNNLISSESSASISHEATLMGEEIFQNTLEYQNTLKGMYHQTSMSLKEEKNKRS
ncbi:hypothetical protein AVEN_42829-1 [Araneus ventricosus]|uniref:Uncharacterized protein n=1 Tax=Araneus ventricosus TaxID=182803 RepID=A0A4Y2AES0_ARAVE|nr:hypothetical protein AVEN_42829-1 [Araneus ventricosus]